jgi:hypothetical protein
MRASSCNQISTTVCIQLSPEGAADGVLTFAFSEPVHGAWIRADGGNNVRRTCPAAEPTESFGMFCENEMTREPGALECVHPPIGRRPSPKRVQKREINMSWEPSINRRIVPISVFGFFLMLVPTGSAFAGISNFSINQAATLAPGGTQVTVTGAVMCPTPETVQISVSITQFVSDHVVGKSGNTPFPGIRCTGAVQNWTVTAGSSAPMQTGAASARANAFACCSINNFESAETTAEVKLQ